MQHAREIILVVIFGFPPSRLRLPRTLHEISTLGARSAHALLTRRGYSRVLVRGM